MYKDRATAGGRLSEFFGEQALPLDKYFRTIGFRKIAAETWKTFSNEDKAMFQAYSDGVNDFI